MPKSRYYKILGLPTTASEKEVKKRYRILVMKYHPDRNSDPNAQELFMRITEAYDIIQDVNFITASKSRTPKTAEEEASDREERMKKARERYKQQEIKENNDNIRFYHSLTNGPRWKRFKLLSIICSIIALAFILDRFLPHHTTKDELSSYSINVARSPSGDLIGAIYTKNGDVHFVSNLDYELFGKTRYIDVESSWIFHNPIYIVAKQKANSRYYRLSFTAYGVSYLFIIIFLLPLFTRWYKRMNIPFTILFYMSYYGVTGLAVLFLLMGNRFLHLITMGFL